MYPPKNVGFFQYISMNLQGLYRANKSDWRSQWSFGIAALAVTYAWFKVSVASKGSKFSQSIRDEKGNWIYGPPSQKFLDELHEHEILHAPHK